MFTKLNMDEKLQMVCSVIADHIYELTGVSWNSYYIKFTLSLESVQK